MKTLLLLLCAACATPAATPNPVPTPAPVPVPAPPPSPPPTGLRLPADVARPIRASVELTIDPSQTAFTGQIILTLDSLRPTSTLWLNAHKLDITESFLVADFADSATIPAHARVGDEDLVGFDLPPNTPAGRYYLHASYRADFVDSYWDGVYRYEQDGAWYVFTQFESTSARRAFPCFDEPGWKIPWTVTLHVPKELVAVSNTAIAEEHEEGAQRTVRFAETLPIPSYLVAFAVGPFEIVDAGRAGANHTPLRIFATRGRRADAAFVAREVGPMLDALEKFFGVPFPYPKLDNVATLAPRGAMENAGIIISAQSYLLADPAHAAPAQLDHIRSVLAHEMAHQWTGDLVTTAWWDDTWLNEGFASWADEELGEMDLEAGRLNDLRRAIAAEALPEARSVRQPIVSKLDIDRAFDDITYDKGAALLHMFDAWLGHDVFHRGLRDYLAAHAHGNATSADFLKALSAAAGRDVATIFGAFLDQPGIPRVSVKVACDAAGARLLLAQERFHAVGTATPAEQWQIPICVRSDRQREASCSLLAERETVLPLAACPAWLLANAGEQGYYQVAYEPKMLEALIAHARELTPSEKVGLVLDAGQMIEAGVVPAADLLPAIGRLAAGADPMLLRTIATTLAGVSRMLPEALRPAWARYLEKTLGQTARSLGWTPKPGEGLAVRSLRGPLLGLVAIHGQDSRLGAEAARLAAAWAKDHHAVDADVLRELLTAAAWNGDATLARALAEVAQRGDRDGRNDLLDALAWFRDPKAAEIAYGVFVGPEGAKNARHLDDGADPERRERFMEAHFDELVDKQEPERAAGLLAVFGARVCDAELRKAYAAFTDERAKKLPSGSERVARRLQAIDQCIAVRAVEVPSLKTFVAGF